MQDLVSLSATEAADHIDRGDVSAEDLARACLARVEAVENDVQAFAHIDPDHVIKQARDLDERRRNGLPTGPLNGVPVGIKDIIDTEDYPTENGSAAMFAGRRPDHDATVVARLRAAGAVIFGKTVSTECAYFHPGKTRNPHDLERTPGGSSSGSAAAVAVGMVPIALGTQTNGSIIRPASFCGVFAGKLGHGLVSRKGVLTLSRHLDHVGPFARSLEDIALVLDVIAGYDPGDPDSRPLAAPDFRRLVREAPPLPPRFAFIRTPVWDRAEADTREAFEAFVAELGAQAVAFDLPASFAGAWEDQRTIMSAEMAHNLLPFVRPAGEAASQALRDLLAEGEKVPAAAYLDAVARSRRYAAGLAEVFEYFDAIITPASLGVAPKGLSATGDPAFCSLWSLTGLPALTLPLLRGEADMPLGVQLVGAAGRDGRLLRTASWLVKRIGEDEDAGD
jgi:Asp-tRNA(Asn)/Glu-tRNA(Gln) amidotransferase A subunit family amidase